MIKRGFDIVFSIVVLIPALPVMTLVAILIKLNSPGAVIFKQARVGLYGKSFDIYKFRTMVVDAATIGPYFTQDGDSRITAVGRFLRKSSLDELPQLFNVLNGDMSIVGPRPNVPEQITEYSEQEWGKRNSVRPGITGQAQALLRSEVTAEERTRLDLDYVDKVSIGFDIRIILLTVRQVLFKGGN